MKTEKTISKPRVTKRKTVSQAIAKQDVEQKPNFSHVLDLQEAIRLKAYELYVERGYTNGDAMEDWLKAEQIILKAQK